MGGQEEPGQQPRTFPLFETGVMEELRQHHHDGHDFFGLCGLPAKGLGARITFRSGNRNIKCHLQIQIQAHEPISPEATCESPYFLRIEITILLRFFIQCAVSKNDSVEDKK